ncbi:GTP cyclohydrolase II [Mangrovicoccus algicola]|uniref:GTP cyclohydrolase II n=1 Tax=Mangrovicoccus algicola TaxID=2771008 RepID=A0A8J7CH68_9RHOB|nr:GTP cyclohydrolase II [Mangrovicoccus algicola]MBE3637905.1 GTP cyclohydrolase II [Mangrovicoccus algicola]
MSETRHIVLTSHPPTGSRKPPEIRWGAPGAQARGPVIGGMSGGQRNVIGTHSGSYGVYRALAIATGQLKSVHRPDLTHTRPSVDIGPFPQWEGEDRIVSMDPYGHIVADAFGADIAAGRPIQPTIAITKARIMLPEFKEAIASGRLVPDGEILTETGEASVTKIAIEPVWYLPGLARRLQVSEVSLRRALFEYTGGMFPELVTRSDLKVFLPPIGSITLYIFGDPAAMWDRTKRLACRVHDECNGSDVFGSDICTCRPYLTHGIEECVKEAQEGGAGLIVYNRKEGRALGEVTKFLVYNARKRNPAGDTAAAYFEKTECVAGVQDMRFQSLMPDVFHWLGITHIDRFVSMSDMKYNALAEAGITVGERIPIPDELIPGDAQVEMDAKKAAGYYTDETVSKPSDLTQTKGRGLDDY